MEINTELNDLIIKMKEINIPLDIDKNIMNKLIIQYENNKLLSINNYTKKLIQIKNNSSCIICNKNGMYSYNNNIYCWTHSHSLI